MLVADAGPRVERGWKAWPNWPENDIDTKSQWVDGCLAWPDLAGNDETLCTQNQARLMQRRAWLDRVAELEIQEGVEWYERQEVGPSRRFWRAADDSMRRLRNEPIEAVRTRFNPNAGHAIGQLTTTLK